jgi:hypothetical protein
MQERIFTTNWFFAGALGANVSVNPEFPFPVRLIGVKAHASNDSDATLAVTSIVTAAVIGDSGDPAYLEPTGAEVAQIAKNTVIPFVLDYDGASGTAAQNVEIVAVWKAGEG